MLTLRMPFLSCRPILGTQHTNVLLYLENLCSHDETVIRERAVTSISKLFVNYSDNEINNFIIPLVKEKFYSDHSISFKLK